MVVLPIDDELSVRIRINGASAIPEHMQDNIIFVASKDQFASKQCSRFIFEDVLQEPGWDDEEFWKAPYQYLEEGIPCSCRTSRWRRCKL